jgi:DNA primase
LAGAVVAVQRTFLAPDGAGKATIENPKRSLGSIARGAVCLAPAGAVVGLAEGIETGLSAMELFHVPVWCALGSNLAGVRLPRAVRQVAIFADRGAAGEAAAEKARETFRLQGRKVTVRLPAIGKDFNDELKARHGS